VHQAAAGIGLRGQAGDYRHDERRPHYKKRGWLDNLGDIFD
jgi:hypothetical protein